jgi:uncharacterized glyoxalase superfamily protein PhnB/mannose-6-phosphate isomerase-like protein (cupin superfamily)
VVFDDQGAATPIRVTENFWDDLERRFGDFSGKLLVSSFRFDRDWDNWEIHPYGDEVVCLLSGDFDLVLDEHGGSRAVRLDRGGSFVVVPRGTWHTAKVRAPSSALFLTPGRGTITKPKDTKGSLSRRWEDDEIQPPEKSSPPAPPILNQLNIVAEDFDQTIAFYRKLGLETVEAPPSPGGIRHAKAKLPDGFLLEFDNGTLARFYNAAWRNTKERGRIVIGFCLPTRDSVDRLYHELLSSGYTSVQSPYDAFWGQRYAIVVDPDGHDVGLMSPPDESRRTWPPVESPAS